MKTRPDKLVELYHWFDPQTGEPRGGSELVRSEEDWFLVGRVSKHKPGWPYSDIKDRRLCKLAEKVRGCEKCDGMNIVRLTEAVPGFGAEGAEVMIVGQSLHKPGMVSGVPFVGGSGTYVVAALWLSDMKREDCFWHNAVACHPERNRPSKDEEKENCRGYLRRYIEIVRPRVILAFGRDAKDSLHASAMDGFTTGATRQINVRHPAALMRGAAPETRIDYIVKLSDEIDRALT